MRSVPLPSAKSSGSLPQLLPRRAPIIIEAKYWLGTRLARQITIVVLFPQKPPRSYCPELSHTVSPILALGRLRLRAILTYSAATAVPSCLVYCPRVMPACPGLAPSQTGLARTITYTHRLPWPLPGSPGSVVGERRRTHRVYPVRRLGSCDRWAYSTFLSASQEYTIVAWQKLNMMRPPLVLGHHLLQAHIALLGCAAQRSSLALAAWPQGDKNTSPRHSSLSIVIA